MNVLSQNEHWKGLSFEVEGVTDSVDIGGVTDTDDVKLVQN